MTDLSPLLGQPTQRSPYLSQALQAMSTVPGPTTTPSGSMMADAIMKQVQLMKNTQANQPAMDSVNANLSAAGMSPIQPAPGMLQKLGGLFGLGSGG